MASTNWRNHPAYDPYTDTIRGASRERMEDLYRQDTYPRGLSARAQSAAQQALMRQQRAICVGLPKIETKTERQYGNTTREILQKEIDNWLKDVL